MRIKILIILFILSLISRAGFNPDSLLTLFKTAKNDSVRCKLYLSLARGFGRVDPEKSLQYANEGIELAEKMHYTLALSRLNNTKGIAYRNRDDYDRAMVFFLKAAEYNLSLGAAGEEDLAANYGNLGGIFQKKAFLSGNQEFRKKAIEYFTMARDIFKKLGKKDGMAGCYVEMGILYHDMARYDESIRQYQQALVIVEEMKFLPGKQTIVNNMGNNYLEMDQLAMAEKSFMQSLDLAKQIGDSVSIGTAYNNLAEIEEKKQNWKKAIAYAEMGLAIGKRFNSFMEIRIGAGKIYKAYKKLGQFEKAIEYLEIKQQYQDSLVNEASNEKMQELEGKFQNEKKALEIENLKKIKQSEHERDQTELKKQTIQKIAFASGFALTMIMAGVVFRSYRRKQKDHQTILHQKEIVDHQKKEILDSITYAKRIQEAILPPQDHIKELLGDCFILYQPKDIVAGDFYWMETSGQEILIAAADCTGHGVPGAMVSVVCCNALNRSVREYGLKDPGKILDKSRELVIDTFSKAGSEVKDGMDISLLQIETGEGQTRNLRWAGANNPLWILRSGNTQIEEIHPDKQPVGLYSHAKPFVTQELNVSKGDTAFIFSDGFADQFGGERGKKLKASKFREMLVSIKDKSMEEQRDFLYQAFQSWRGSLEQVDDVCIIGIRF